MENIVFYLPLLCAFGMITAAVHIGGGSAHVPRRRFFFVLSALVIAGECLAEAACTAMAGHAEYAGLMTALIVLEYISAPFLLVAECLACGMGRLAKFIGGFAALCTVFQLACLPSGLVFSVSAGGMYQLGPYAAANTVLSFLQVACLFLMLYMLGRRFGYRNPGTLVFMVLLPLAGIGCGLLADTDSDCLETLSHCFVFFLLYGYYSGLVLHDMQSRITDHNARIGRLSLELTSAMAGAVDAKDRYTSGHSRRVAEYAVLLGRELGWSEDRLNRLRFAALMHDVGKIGVPDSVLNKPSRLNSIEYDMVKAHTILGARIIPSDPDLPEAWTAARSHHERYDGSGYPDGLSGDDIPLIARIIGIADSFDAMNSNRVYRAAIPRSVIRAELEKGLGSQFDPTIGRAFLALFDSGALDAVAEDEQQNTPEAAPNEEFLRFADNLFQFLSHGEYAALWESGDPHMNGLFRYIENLTGYRQEQYSIAVFTIAPKDGQPVTEDRQEEAVHTMLKVIAAESGGRVACGQLSPTNLAAVFHGPAEGEIPVSEQMRNILLAYYKSFDSALFDVSYRLQTG